MSPEPVSTCLQGVLQRNCSQRQLSFELSTGSGGGAGQLSVTTLQVRGNVMGCVGSRAENASGYSSGRVGSLL
jgi:hypothetical protein